MPLGYEDSSCKSRELFESHIAPRLLRVFPGEIYPVEGEPHVTLRMLDMAAGVDFLHLSRSGCVRGIASRMQCGDRNWATFTVRENRASGARTELAKRNSSLVKNAISPELTVQAYFSNAEKLFGFAVAREKDILALINRGRCKRRTTGADQIGQATFAYVDWSDLIACRRPLLIYDAWDAVLLHHAPDGTVQEYADDELNEGFDRSIDDGDKE